MPLMIGAAVKASKDNKEFFTVFKDIILADTVFLYCSAFIAPFVILTFTIMFKNKKEDYYFYPFALIGSFYVVILGSLMYAGVVARNLYSLGAPHSNITYPTTADLSIVIVTFLVWYYCMYKENYQSRDAAKDYEREAKQKFEKFDRAIK